MKKYLARITICLLVVFMLCGCGPKNPPEDETQKVAPASSTRVSDELVTPEGRVSNSKPIDIEPIEGIRIAALENALYDDTEFRVSDVKEDDKRLLSANSFFEEEDFYPFAAYEIDAGLKSDEYFPEGYTVSLDLNKLDIDKELYDYLTVYRLDDDGNTYEYICDIEGDKLVLESAQNSMFVIGGCIVFEGIKICAKLAERNEVEGYYELDSNSYAEKTGRANGGKYRIIYSPSDMGFEYRKQCGRYAYIVEEIKKEAKEEMELNSFSMFGFFQNRKLVEEVDRKIAKNEDLKKLTEQLKNPPALKIFEDRINYAFSYLCNTEKLKMPRFVVDFYLKADTSDMGQEIDGKFADSYIIIKAGTIDTMLRDNHDGEEERDDLLLTITHELFHICQQRYHVGMLGFSKNTKYDEAVALVLESDAKEHYTEYCYINTDPALTEAKYWEDMIIPMDELATKMDSGEKNNTVDIRSGYLLSRFIQYLRRETGKKVRARELMEARHYLWSTDLSGPFASVFGLTEAQFDSYYRSFFVEEKNAYKERYISANGKYDYPQRTPINLVYNGKVKVDINNRKNYHAEIQPFTEVTDQETALLVILDSGVAATHGEVTLVPLDSYGRTSLGAFIPSDNSKAKGESHYMLEIYGKAEPKDLGSSYYTVYSLNPLSLPEAKTEKNNLVITIKDKSEAGKDGYLEGYAVKINAGGNETIRYYTYKEAEKDISIPIKELGDKDNTLFDVSYSEYLINSKDEKKNGPWSEERSIGDDELVWALDSLTYTEYNKFEPEPYEQEDDCVGPNGENTACLVAVEAPSLTTTKCDDKKCEYHYEEYGSDGSIVSTYDVTSDVGEKYYVSNKDMVKFIEKETLATSYVYMYVNGLYVKTFFGMSGEFLKAEWFDENVPKFEKGASFDLQFGGVTRHYVAKTLSQANKDGIKHIISTPKQ